MNSVSRRTSRTVGALLAVCGFALWAPADALASAVHLSVSIGCKNGLVTQFHGTATGLLGNHTTTAYWDRDNAETGKVETYMNERTATTSSTGVLTTPIVHLYANVDGSDVWADHVSGVRWHIRVPHGAQNDSYYISSWEYCPSGGGTA